MTHPDSAITDPTVRDLLARLGNEFPWTYTGYLPDDAPLAGECVVRMVDQFGTTTLRPVSGLAEAIARIAGTTTVRPADIITAAEYGIISGLIVVTR